jgi:hypothetical protein
MTKLRYLARVIRSKNAGPFEITFDVIFDDRDRYEHVKASNAIRIDVLAKSYGVGEQDVVTFMFFDAALAFKLTLRRPANQGSTGERDTFGAQQHAPLLDIDIPESASVA